MFMFNRMSWKPLSSNLELAAYRVHRILSIQSLSQKDYVQTWWKKIRWWSQGSIWRAWGKRGNIPFNYICSVPQRQWELCGSVKHFSDFPSL